MSSSTLTAAPQPDYRVHHPDGMWYLRIAGAVSILYGVSEFIAAFSRWWLISILSDLPWLDYMLSSGPALLTYMPQFGIVLGILYTCMGIIGVAFSSSEKLAKLLSYLCVATFAFHLASLIAAYAAGVLVYTSILFLAIPVVYFLGAAQNTNSSKLKTTAIAYSFIAPNLIGFSIFTLIPMVFALVLGFMEWNLRDRSLTFVGFDNFARFATDHLFWPSLTNTLYFTIITVPLTMVMALGLALLLNRGLKGRAIFRGVMFFPYVASLIAMAAVWNQIFHPSWGPVNQFLMSLGMEEGPRWTTAPWIIPNIAFFTAWRNMGYFMVIYLAGLQSIPRELYEAAAIDGAGKWSSFWKITLPQLRFVTFFVSVMLTIMCFRVYDQVLMITNTENPGSSSTMLVVHIFRSAFVNWDFGYASALSLVLLAIVMTVTMIQFAIQRRYENE